MLSSSQLHAAITNYCRNGETAARQRLCSSRTNENNNRDGEIGPVQSATVLSDHRWAGSVAVMGGDSAGVSQTLDGHGGSRGRLVGHSWGGGRHASRVATDVLGLAVMWSEIH